MLNDLGGDPQGQHPLVVQPADPGLGLQVGVIDDLGLVAALDHHVGGREGRVHFTPVDVPLTQQVALGVHGGAPSASAWSGSKTAGSSS